MQKIQIIDAKKVVINIKLINESLELDVSF